MAGSIQQSLNQALIAGTYALGSYQRTPAGRSAALLKRRSAIDKKDPDYKTLADTREKVKLTEAAYSLNPTKKIQKILDKDYEEEAGREAEIYAAKQQQKKKEMEKKLLSNDPNYQLRKELDRSINQKGEQKKQFKERIKILFDKKEEN